LTTWAPSGQHPAPRPQRYSPSGYAYNPGHMDREETLRPRIQMLRRMTAAEQRQARLESQAATAPPLPPSAPRTRPLTVATVRSAGPQLLARSSRRPPQLGGHAAAGGALAVVGSPENTGVAVSSWARILGEPQSRIVEGAPQRYGPSLELQSHQQASHRQGGLATARPCAAETESCGQGGPQGSRRLAGVQIRTRNSAGRETPQPALFATAPRIISQLAHSQVIARYSS